MTAAIRVVKPGLLTTVQDLGRWGTQARGVSVSGAMDPRSHRLANALAGNTPDAATLEVTIVGPVLEFEDERQVAVVGATFDLLVNGVLVDGATAFKVAHGTRLVFGHRRRGTRAYVAVSGGVAVPLQLGSRATHVLSRMGGYLGRALISGDRLPLGDPRPALGKASKPTAIAIPNGHAAVRVLPGPQHDRFVEDALDVLQSAPYRVANESDRMGFRLSGPALTRRTELELISDATPLGVLQVPPSGQPVLLMADRQTTGGYPKIGTVITADIGLAGQLGPGDSIAFTVCSQAEAISALIAQERLLMAAESAAGA